MNEPIKVLGVIDIIIGKSRLLVGQTGVVLGLIGVIVCQTGFKLRDKIYMTQLISPIVDQLVNSVIGMYVCLLLLVVIICITHG